MLIGVRFSLNPAPIWAELSCLLTLPSFCYPVIYVGVNSMLTVSGVSRAISGKAKKRTRIEMNPTEL